MRIWFWLLLLLNVAAFAWFTRFAPPPEGEAGFPVPASPQDAGQAGKPLLLLSERRMQSAAVAREETAKRPDPAETPTPVRRCFEVGPFANAVAAQRFLERLSPPPRRQRLFQRPVEVAAGYWVRWPEILDLRAARKVYRELRGRGVTDIAIAAQGDGRYAVSLGVFRRRDTMEERRQRLADLGYEVAVVERTREEPRSWLHLEYGTERPTSWTARGEESEWRVREQDCPQAR